MQMSTQKIKRKANAAEREGRMEKGLRFFLNKAFFMRKYGQTEVACCFVLQRETEV